VRPDASRRRDAQSVGASGVVHRDAREAAGELVQDGARRMTLRQRLARSRVRTMAGPSLAAGCGIVSIPHCGKRRLRACVGRVSTSAPMSLGEA